MKTIYEVLKESKNYGANHTLYLKQHTENLLIDYQQGYEIDKDELIECLVDDILEGHEMLNGELEERNLMIP